MTKEEAIKYLMLPVSTSTVMGEETAKQFEAYRMAVEALRQEPTAHAHWIILPPVFEEICECSNCKTSFKQAYQHREYCPFCGAIMDEKIEG